MPAPKPSLADIESGIARYERGDRSWNQTLNRVDWFISHQGQLYPLKYTFALATNVPVADFTTDQMKAVMSHLNLTYHMAAEVLRRAAGNCECCCQPAPFLRASDGSPYLEGFLSGSFRNFISARTCGGNSIAVGGGSARWPLSAMESRRQARSAMESRNEGKNYVTVVVNDTETVFRSGAIDAAFAAISETGASHMVIFDTGSYIAVLPDGGVIGCSDEEDLLAYDQQRST